MGLFQFDQEDDEEKKRERAIAALSAIAREARGEQDAWKGEGQQYRELGFGNDAAPKVVDPTNSMDPESFEFAARHPSQLRPNTQQPDEAFLDDHMQLDRDPNAPVREAQREPAMDLAPDRNEPTRAEPAQDRAPERESLVLDAPDAIRGLTGREASGQPSSRTSFRETEDDGAPGINPWAVAAALLTGGSEPGRAVAGVMQTAAGQKQQWQAAQRQKALDAQDAEYKQAQIRHLDASGKGSAADRDWQQWKDTDLSNRGYEDQRIRELEANRKAIGTELQVNKFGQQTDPDSALSRTQVELSHDKAAAGAKGREEGKHEMIDTTAADAGRLAAVRAAAGTSARQDVIHDNAERTRGDAAAQADVTTRARDGARADSPQVIAQQSDQYVKEADKDIQTARQIDKLDTILRNYKPGQLPGIGTVEGRMQDSAIGRGINGLLAANGDDKAVARNEDALAVGNARSQMVDLLQRARSGAAGPEAEKYVYQLQTGSAPGANEAEFRTGLNAMRAITRGSLATKGAGKEKARDRVLGADGLGHWVQQPQAPAAPQAPKFSLGSTEDDEDDPYAKFKVR